MTSSRPEHDGKMPLCISLPKDQIIETSKGLVTYSLTGSGPVIMALHGAMGGADQSFLLAQSLAPSGYRFLALSRPGYPGTSLDLGRKPEEQADLCASLLDALSIESTIVAAVSGGGRTAVQFALRHSIRCRALILVSTCTEPMRSKTPLVFRLFPLIARIPWLVSMMRRKILADPEGTASRSISDPAARKRTLSHPEAGPLFNTLRLSMFERMVQRLPGTGNDIIQFASPAIDGLERISCPTLVIQGTADPVVPFEKARKTAASIPDAEMLMIENGGHTSLFTDLDTIRITVADFLKRRT